MAEIIIFLRHRETTPEEYINDLYARASNIRVTKVYFGTYE